MWAARYWAPRYRASRYWAPAGLTAPGFYWGRYWGRDYWSASYWSKQADSNPFVATVSTGLATTTGMTLGSMTVAMTNAHTVNVTTGLTTNASVGLNATPTIIFANEFIAAAPLALPTVACGISLSASVVLGFVVSAGNGYYWSGRYWAAKYWAPRYWETQIEFEAAVTSGLSTSVGVTAAAVVQQDLVANILSGLSVGTGIALAGSVSATDSPPPGDNSGGGHHRPKKRRYLPDDDPPIEKPEKPVIAKPRELPIVIPPPVIPDRVREVIASLAEQRQQLETKPQRTEPEQKAKREAIELVDQQMKAAIEEAQQIEEEEAAMAAAEMLLNS